MPKPVASLKVSRWFGEELRQWRRPSQTSSATPRMVVIDGIACRGGRRRCLPPLPQRSLFPLDGGSEGDWLRLWSMLWGTLAVQWLVH